MTIQFIEESTLTAMADAIRAGTGKTGTMKPSNMPTEIAAIKTYSREGKYVWSVQSGNGTTVDANAETKYVASNDKNAYPSDGWVGHDYFKLVKGGLKIVTWADGTDEEIAAMVDAADKGEINLADYWNVGDERTVSLSAMAATGVGESHAAQTATLVLMDKTCTGFTFATATSGGKTKPSFIVGLKNSLAEAGYMNEARTNANGWSGSERRTWCNNVFRMAIPSGLRGIFKQFKWKQGQGGRNSSGLLETTDYFGFAPEKAVFGSNTYSFADEAALYAQWAWYKTAANRIKKMGESGSARNWWECSPGSGINGIFCDVDSGGYASSYAANGARGLAPFGCI